MDDPDDGENTRQEWMILMTVSIQDKNGLSGRRGVYKTRIDDPDDGEYTRQEWMIRIKESIQDKNG